MATNPQLAFALELLGSLPESTAASLGWHVGDDGQLGARVTREDWHGWLVSGGVHPAAFARCASIAQQFAGLSERPGMADMIARYQRRNFRVIQGGTDS